MRAITAFFTSIVGLTALNADAAPLADRFASEIAVFAQQNLRGKVRGGTLLVGSSSIRLWSVAGTLPASGAVNRGFGGATTADVLRHYPIVTGSIQPDAVVVYVGENDIALGRTPETVTADVLTLLGRLRTDFPLARIAYLSMKPSPRRWRLWSQMTAVNEALAARSRNRGGFDFVDVAHSLLDPAGTPDIACFSPDGLHMNPLGYARWNMIVSGYLAAPDTGRKADRTAITRS